MPLISFNHNPPSAVSMIQRSSSCSPATTVTLRNVPAEKHQPEFTADPYVLSKTRMTLIDPHRAHRSASKR